MRFQKLITASFFTLLTACSQVPDKPSTEASASPAPAASDNAATPEPTIVYKPFEQETLYQLLVAEVALQRQQYDVALGNYLAQAHHTQDAGIAEHTTKLARYLKANRAALDAALLWSNLETENQQPHLISALLLIQQQRPREALEHFNQIEALGGIANYSLVVSGSSHLATDQRAELLLDINELLQQKPENTELLISKAILLQQAGLGEDALNTTRHVLSLAPMNLRAINLEARLLLSLNQADVAFQRYQRLLKEKPGDRKIRLDYARLLTKVDLNAAQTEFEVLSDAAPEDGDLLYSLALIQLQNGDYNSARQRLEKLVTLKQHEDKAHLHLGRLAEQAQDNVAAISHYLAVTPGKEMYEATRGLVRLYLKQGAIDSAIAQVTAAQQQDQPQSSQQNQAKYFLLHANLLSQAERLNESLSVLNQGLEAHPNHPELLYTRAMTHEELDDIPSLESDLRQLLDQNPDNATALNALGYTLADRTTRYHEALDLINRALEIRPGDPAILDSMGWLQFKLGNLQAAEDYLSKAFEGFPDDEVAAHYGEVLWLLNKAEQAKAIWRSVLSQDPEAPFSRATIDRLGIALESIIKPQSSDNGSADHTDGDKE